MKRQVVVGPAGPAHNHAHRWGLGQAIAVTSAAELVLVDPLTIDTIHLIAFDQLTDAEIDAITAELLILRTVWPEIRVIAEPDTVAQLTAC